MSKQKLLAFFVIVGGLAISSEIIFYSHLSQSDTSNVVGRVATTTFQNALQQALNRFSTISTTLISTDYQNTDPAFSMTVPTGFVYVKGTRVSVPKQFAVAISQNSPRSERDPAMGVRVYETSLTLDEKHASDIALFKGAGAKIYSDDKTTINGIPAYLTVMTVAVPPGVTSLRQMDARMVVGGYFYLVQGVALETDWAKYKIEFENAIRSFKVD
ncbi:hypothetical protein KGQ72_00570 [Patescibacteria group bacterium]|nr:hypothetical protein [Patescibacteria group bacterium]